MIRNHTEPVSKGNAGRGGVMQLTSQGLREKRTPLRDHELVPRPSQNRLPCFEPVDPRRGALTFPRAEQLAEESPQKLHFLMILILRIAFLRFRGW